MVAKLLLLCLLAFLVKGQITYPNLTLPWGTWRATKYDKNGDFFTFQNVRFGRATNGTMRFKAPSYPEPIKDKFVVQNSTYGPACPQIDPSQPCRPDGCIGAPIVAPVPETKESEDCLFLDIYVPSSAFSSGTPPLPVVVWIYGGGYLSGSKSVNDLFYNGTGIVQAAAAADRSKVIFIAGNYRVGAFGWLAGSQMERDATPNAGLYDQRLVLQWVQDYVHLIGGDKSKVSAWGESAGAGSILHHLISHNGQQNPLFSKAILQSPAFQWQWDRTGTIDDMYKNFSNLAGCEDHSINCLQQASTATLIKANQELFENTLPCTGLYPVGPALDGKLIQQLPPVAFDSGNYWKGLESIIVSHVYNESGTFIPKFIQNSSSVKKYVGEFFPQPKLTELRTAVLNQYPADGPPYWGNARNRTEAIIRDLSFTCSTRLLYDAYHQKANTYMMQYDVLKTFGLAFHGTDLLPLFLNPDFDCVAFLKQRFPDLPPWMAQNLCAIAKELSTRYQSYFVSHAIHGNPNTGRFEGTPEWKLATNDSNRIHQVMEVDGNIFKFFHPEFTDDINTNEACDFWKSAAWKITELFPGASHSVETQPMQAVLHEVLK